MADFYLKSGASAVVYSNKAWTNGEKMVPTRSDATSNVATAKKWVWEVTTAGTSTATPTWSASVTQDVTTVTDGTVVWTARKPGFSSGSTADWSFAAIYMDYVATALAVGDRLFVSGSHAESHGASITITFPGTAASPNIVLSVNDAAAPPVVVTTTAAVTTTSTSSITVSGSAHLYGIVFTIGSGGSASNFNIGGSAASLQVFDTCDINLTNISGSSRILLGNTGASAQIADVVFKNTDVKFGNATQGFFCNRGRFRWSGGSILSGSTAQTGNLFSANGGTNQGFHFEGIIEGVDFSNLGTAANLVSCNTITTPLNILFRNSKLPASWSGSLVGAGSVPTGYSVRMHNCDNADTNYRVWEEHFAGTIRSETVVVKTGGSTDGDTPFSIKMTSNANCNSIAVLRSPVIARRNSTTGSAVNVAIDFLHDSATNLTNAKVYAEGQYLGTSGFPLSSFILDAPSSPLAAAADQSASTAEWTTTGLTTPNKQKAELSLTAQEKGYVAAHLILAEASTTIYADSVLQVS